MALYWKFRIDSSGFPGPGFGLWLTTTETLYLRLWDSYLSHGLPDVWGLGLQFGVGVRGEGLKV